MNKLIDRLKAVLEINLDVAGLNPRGIKQIYKGDPITDIPNVNMPCIIIDPISTMSVKTDSCSDEKVQSIQVAVLLDARQYFNDNDDETAKFELTKIMEEEDSGFFLKNDTVLYSVRQTLIEDFVYSTGRNDDMPILYGEFGGGGDREFPTVFAALTFTIQRVPYIRD